MLGVFRARACCLVTAVVLAASTATVTVGELLHAGTAHDADCRPAAEPSHDAGSHRYEAVPTATPEADDHCLACHLARAPRVGAESAAPGVPGAEAVTRRLSDSADAALGPAVLVLQPRSPPGLA